VAAILLVYNQNVAAEAEFRVSCHGGSFKSFEVFFIETRLYHYSL